MTSPVDHTLLKSRFDALKPWTARFVIDGVLYGGYHEAFPDKRLILFESVVKQHASILEVGCMEGEHTVQLAVMPHTVRVCGIDVKPSNLDKARFVASLFGRSNVSFALKNVEVDSLEDLGHFDVAICVSVLHLLRRPWVVFQNLRPVVEALFFEAYYVDLPHTQEGRYQGKVGHVNVPPTPDPQGAVVSETFIPTRASLHQMIHDIGFKIRRAFYTPRKEKNSIAQIYAVKA